MITKEGSTKIDFVASGAGVLVLGHGHIHVSYIEKMQYFFRIVPLYSLALKRHIMYWIIKNKEESTKMCKFYEPPPPGTAVHVLG